MIYALTLLKDLPEYPAGTIFKLYGMRMPDGLRKKPFYEVGVPNKYWPGHMDVKYYSVGSFIDDPKWFKKEIDTDYLVDLKCPKCGKTEGNFFSTSYYGRHFDSNDYGVQFSVGFECVCGHKRVLYGTKYGNRKIREKINN